jgi:hypothetical protein
MNNTPSQKVHLEFVEIRPRLRELHPDAAVVVGIGRVGGSTQGSA